MFPYILFPIIFPDNVSLIIYTYLVIFLFPVTVTTIQGLKNCTNDRPKNQLHPAHGSDTFLVNCKQLCPIARDLAKKCMNNCFIKIVSDGLGSKDVKGISSKIREANLFSPFLLVSLLRQIVAFSGRSKKDNMKWFEK